MNNTKNILLIDKFIIERFHQLRKEKKITVKEIADILGVEDSFIRKIETNQNKFNIHHLFLLSFYFKIPISDFFPNEINFKKINLKQIDLKNEFKTLEILHNRIKEEIELKRKK